MKQVTVVIPNYNGIKFIRGCLDALYSQGEGAPEFETIVVDNGSADGSREIVKDEYPAVKLVELAENTGFCHAVNVGIELAETPFVILLNNDTKVDENYLMNLCRAMDQRPDAFSISAKMLMWDKPELLDDAGDRYCMLGWAFARGKGKPAANFDKPCQVFAACGGAAIYRKSVFTEIGLFDEQHFAYLEDLDIGYRARIYGYHNYYEPTAAVIHYGSASSGSRYNEWKTTLASANSVYVIGKNMPLLQWIWNLPFLLLGFFVKFLFFCRKGYGSLYLKGLGKGLKKCFTPEGRKAKVPFRFQNLSHYLSIQLTLYTDFFQILKKS